MRLKNTLLVILITIPLFVSGQSSDMLKDLLWSRVKRCYTMTKELNDSEEFDFIQIDDTSNGYLKVKGSWPGCGCSCQTTVGAYKNEKNEYIILQSETIPCSWERKISSNKELKEILPVDFGVNSFMQSELTENYPYPIFFIDFEIPIKGTDTKTRLELIPFGLYMNETKVSCFGYSQHDASQEALYGIRHIAQKITHVNTLDLIISGDYDKISKRDKELISLEIGGDRDQFHSLTALQNSLKRLKEIYEIYCLIDSDEIILGWDRATSRFFKKEKGKNFVKKSFRDFLLSQKYWDWVC